MSIEIKINTEDLQRFIKTKSKVFFTAAKKHISAASWAFIRFITLQQLSGRITANYGLNVITGTLRRSFKSKTIGNADAGDVITKIFSSAKYAQYHQTGTRRFPKRLFIFEEYNKTGLKIYREELSLAIKEAMR